jgi:hypothetical protein
MLLLLVSYFTLENCMEINTNIGIGFSRPERSSKAPTAEAVLANRENGQARKPDAIDKPDTARIASKPLSSGNNLPQEEGNARLSQALLSVQKNLEKNPGNKGLENAMSRIERNIARYQEPVADSEASRHTVDGCC